MIDLELQKEDIPILDFIIDELCKTGVYFVTAKYLAEKKVFNFGNIKTVGDLAFNETDSKEFERLVGIIKKSGKAKVSEQLFEKPLSVSRNSETLHFQKLGGFKNEFKKQKKPLNWYKIIPILVAIIFGGLNVYQKYDYNNLKNNYDFLKVERDSLKLKLTYMNNNSSVNKGKPLLDTVLTPIKQE